MFKKNTKSSKKKFKKFDEDEYVSYNPENDIYSYNEDEDEDEEEEIDYDELEKKKRQNRPKIPKEKFYVDPKKFDDEIVKYYDNDIISDELAEMVSKIANKLSYSSNFAGYTYREEMVGDGIVRMFKALISRKYDRDKGTNPFSYFTRIAFNAFRNRIKKEKTIHEAQERYQQEYMIMSEGYANLLKNNQTSITRDLNSFDND
jgi:hypothetical protein